MKNSESQAEAKEKPAQDKHGDAVKGGVLKHIKQDYQCYENGENYAFGSFHANVGLVETPAFRPGEETNPFPPSLT